MPEEQEKIVPFGKYKGRPIEELLVDTEYCRWLIAQNWFQLRYTEIHQYIVSGPSIVTEDTPEHNRLQVLFLNPYFCSAFLSVAFPNLILKHVPEVTFELRGIDVAMKFEIRRAYEDVSRKEKFWYQDKCAAIEIKPSIGDDFPAILRQVRKLHAPIHNRYGQQQTWDYSAVLYEHLTTSNVTLDQIQGVFGQIRLVSLASVQST